jgi:hypothetical protein
LCATMYHSGNEENTLYSVPETLRMLYNNASFRYRGEHTVCTRDAKDSVQQYHSGNED